MKKNILLLNKLESLEQRFKELEQQLADANIIKNPTLYQKLAKELSDISPIVHKFRQSKSIQKQIDDLNKMCKESSDFEFIQLAKSELEELDKKQIQLQKEIESFFISEDKDADRDVIMEIRAGTGGQEAAIFAGDLYRMYTKYAISKNWKIEEISSNPTEIGGFKEIIFSLRGKSVYKRLQFESGVHRVQRIPQTEASGRIHTSTATVAVLMEPEEIELTIEPKDLKIDVFRSSGRGGQHVNVTDSAVRITHLPTGFVVTCQDERSQLKNKNKALRVLRARLLDHINNQKLKEQSQLRKSQIGSGDRSEKIRTYNFPDRRITDHRIGLTVYNLEEVLDGSLDVIIDALIAFQHQQEKNG